MISGKRLLFALLLSCVAVEVHAIHFVFGGHAYNLHVAPDGTVRHNNNHRTGNAALDAAFLAAHGPAAPALGGGAGVGGGAPGPAVFQPSVFERLVEAIKAIARNTAPKKVSFLKYLIKNPIKTLATLGAGYLCTHRKWEFLWVALWGTCKTAVCTRPNYVSAGVAAAGVGLLLPLLGLYMCYRVHKWLD